MLWQPRSSPEWTSPSPCPGLHSNSNIPSGNHTEADALLHSCADGSEWQTWVTGGSRTEITSSSAATPAPGSESRFRRTGPDLRFPPGRNLLFVYPAPQRSCSFQSVAHTQTHFLSKRSLKVWFFPPSRALMHAPRTTQIPENAQQTSETTLFTLEHMNHIKSWKWDFLRLHEKWAHLKIEFDCRQASPAAWGHAVVTRRCSTRCGIVLLK